MSRAPRSPSFRDHPLRRELLALYAEAEALLTGVTCDASTDCCRFGVTGREPYPTAIERAELTRGMQAGGVRLNPTGTRPRTSPRTRLQVSDERRCPLLDDAGRCRVYQARPFGCRTFFCERGRDASGDPAVLPRRELQALGRRVADLSARFDPRDPGPAPLSRSLRV
jgi:Fe-S-cluster containining protein